MLSHIVYKETSMEWSMGQKPGKVKKTVREKNHLGWKEGIAQSLSLPKDLMFGAVILTVTGRNEAYVENYKGIIEYTKTKIKLQTKTCRLEIQGTELLIAYYTDDEMRITGQFEQIKYC